MTLRKPPLYVRDGIPGSGGSDWLANKYEFILCCTNGGKLKWSNPSIMGHRPVRKSGRFTTHRQQNGARVRRRYRAPDLANPGNLIDCGAGTQFGLGNHNEAPFPKYLVEFFVRSFCPPGGTVLDIFCGSGTTLAVAKRFGRNAIGIDIRESQVELSRRRVAAVQQGFFQLT